MVEMEIRNYKPEYFDQVWNLHTVALENANAFVGHGKWDDDLKNIKKVYEVFLVGTLEGKIFAMGALKKIDDKTGEIKRMRVLPEFQRKGFGGKILLALEKEAKNRGFENLVLDTTILQKTAQNLYLKNNYCEIKRTKEGFPFETIFYKKQLI